MFRRYKDALYLTSLKYCRNEAEAEDNLHDAFVTIFESIKSFKGSGSFEGWMKRITINKAINKYKSGKLVQNNWNHDLHVETEVDWNETGVSLDVILNSIQQLPDQYRLIFNLYQLDGYSHKEIGEVLGISEGTSRSNFHRARNILKEKIAEPNHTKKNIASS